MHDRIFSVAVDGPGGAGKSTLAKAAAARLGILYVDTGAIYRTIGLAAFQSGVASRDAASVLALLPALRIELRHGADGVQHMRLDGEDVTEKIRLPEISRYASDVSAIAGVRDYLMDMQRDLAKKQSVIMDGRDIGTVVLPDADVKIFLTASGAVRAKRRYLELAARGTEKPYEDVLQELEERDYNDSHRAVAPLRPAKDAVVIDTSALDFAQSLALLLKTIEERLNG